MQNFSLSGRVVLVTGARRGIGLATARALARQGARVALLDIDAIEVQAAAAALAAGGAETLALAADVGDRQQVQAGVDSVVTKWGQIDALVNAAGIHELVALPQLQPDAFRRMLRVNVMGTFHCTQAVLPGMVSRGTGAIVCLASLAGRRGHPTGGAHYAASKGAVIAFARSAAREMGPQGVRVNCIAPGQIETDMVKGFTPEERDAYRRGVPLGRIGQPEDIADVAVFLCTDASRYITGQVLNVCGGVLMA